MLVVGKSHTTAPEFAHDTSSTLKFLVYERQIYQIVLRATNGLCQLIFGESFSVGLFMAGFILVIETSFCGGATERQVLDGIIIVIQRCVRILQVDRHPVMKGTMRALGAPFTIENDKIFSLPILANSRCRREQTARRA
ncbi:hypothetical protein ACPOL_6972 (plasmid) [Acidisarcina polymorpha]|uniref:Uncharacterized protein n=1 Tax=Acidisarcina polymorpha TaxID=2211140 RepID=A0A2Z5GBZ9_9BACT|nr:hypothetical protein ACPOL_6972 [Acidisarcina polymorpha]